MDEKFLNKIVELQNLFDEGVVTTADNIPQPEPRQDVVDREAINRFMRDNPMADGGRINFDGGGSPLQKFKQEIVESMKHIYRMRCILMNASYYDLLLSLTSKKISYI